MSEHVVQHLPKIGGGGCDTECQARPPHRGTMKNVAERVSDIAEWLMDPHDAKEVVERLGFELGEHLGGELRALLDTATALAATYQGRDAAEKAAVAKLPDVIKRLLGSRLAAIDDAKAGFFVELDCATCASLGSLYVPMACVSARAEVAPWTKAVDPEGQVHCHDPNRRQLVFRCRAGHHLHVAGRPVCWCGHELPGPA